MWHGYLYSFQKPGPLAEIDFWRERAATLSPLSEQLKQPVVKKILEVMTNADPVTVQNLELTVAELNQYHVESVDNVRFLSTLERHFKVSQHSNTFYRYTENHLHLTYSVLHNDRYLANL